jgi:hypothetical protein
MPGLDLLIMLGLSARCLFGRLVRAMNTTRFFKIEYKRIITSGLTILIGYNFEPSMAYEVYVLEIKKPQRLFKKHM